MITKKWLNTTVQATITVKKGLDVLKQNKIDIVLMDSNAVMDGHEASKLHKKW
jgi:CheY-like chemotaxis protein